MHPSMMAVHAALYTDATTHADEDSRTRPPTTPTEIPLPWLEPTPKQQKNGPPPQREPASTTDAQTDTAAAARSTVPPHDDRLKLPHT